MLAYLATKSQFLDDAPVIEDVVAKAVRENLHIHVGDSEYKSWRNSLGNAMSHVMHDQFIPDDAAVAVEYRLNGRKFRIDFLIGGKNRLGQESVVIVELKQWTDVGYSPLSEHVSTFVGGGIRDVPHPSYQASSYAAHLSQFNEYVYENAVQVSSCAYLHNCSDSAILRDARFFLDFSKSPVFLKGEVSEVRNLIKSHISAGIGTDFIEAIDKARIRPSQQLADAAGSMLQGNEEFVLIDDQKTALERIIDAAKLAQTGNRQVLIIKGGPGTGKSVIAINAVAHLTSLRLNAKYVTANSAPREVFKEKLKGTSGVSVGDLFSGSGGFVGQEEGSFDALIVDEAHRLKKRTQYARGGVNQIHEIIRAAKLSVFFIDEAQKVTWQDIGEIEAIRNFASMEGADIREEELSSQFRCSGSDDYMAWLDDVLGVKAENESYFSSKSYDFRIVSSPTELRNLIVERNALGGKSRLVAGYCWDWVSKNAASKSDLVFPEYQFEAQWNLLSHGQAWLVRPDSIKQIGCIHTCQGLELDYVGVIVGPDLKVIDGVLATDPTARAKTDKSLNGFKKAFKENPQDAAKKADELIRNTYRTLMTRGMKGCFIWCTDNETANYLRARLPGH